MKSKLVISWTKCGRARLAPNYAFAPTVVAVSFKPIAAVRRRFNAEIGVMKNTIVRPNIELLWFSTVDAGRQLELNCQVEGMSYQLATIIADESDESLWFEICVAGKIVQLPIATVQKALEAAVGNVRSEAWFERNNPELQSPELSRAGRAYLKSGWGNDT